LADGSSLLIAGSGAQFGLWPCGASKLYWFLTRNARQGTKQGKAGALAVCRNWAAPAAEVIAATDADAILQNDIVDRPPLPWWGRGPVTLLGDAAHATTPNLGQGACQALEDAVVLADCVRRVQPAEAALREYERLRIPRTTAIVRDSQRSGRLFQTQQPVLAALRNWFMGSLAGRGMAIRMLRDVVSYRVPRL